MVFVKHEYESAIGTHVSPPSWAPLPPPSTPYPFRLSQSRDSLRLSAVGSFHLLRTDSCLLRDRQGMRLKGNRRTCFCPGRASSCRRQTVTIFYAMGSALWRVEPGEGREPRRLGLLINRAWSEWAFPAGLPVLWGLPQQTPCLPLRQSDSSQQRAKDLLLLAGRLLPPTSWWSVIREVQASAIRQGEK